MSCYKIIFAKNVIISCTKTKQVLAENRQTHFEHHKGRVIHAFIKAASEENARTIAIKIMKDGKVKKQ